MFALFSRGHPEGKDAHFNWTHQPLHPVTSSQLPVALPPCRGWWGAGGGRWVWPADFLFFFRFLKWHFETHAELISLYFFSMTTAHDMLKKNVPKVSTSKCTPEYSTPNCHQNKCYHCNGLEQCQTMQHCKLKKLDAVMSFFFLQVAGHTARCPENPWGRESRLWCTSPHKCHDCSTSMITTPRRKKIMLRLLRIRVCWLARISTGRGWRKTCWSCRLWSTCTLSRGRKRKRSWLVSKIGL